MAFNIDIGNSLQGIGSGIVVFKSSSQSGITPTINIRGSNNPLIVIDGISRGSLSDINPNDIESIAILKDASSQSIYGTEGISGVINIITKKGNSDGHRV